MSNIVPTMSSGVERRGSRLAARAVVSLDRQTDIGLARIEHAAELQVGRVQAVGYVGNKAMHEVALVSQLEANLCALVPMAVSRLQAIGDMVALAAAEVVSQTVRRVSR